MSLYYRPQELHSSGSAGGSSGDGADGGNKLFENVMHISSELEPAATGASGFGYTPAADSVGCNQFLHAAEITGTECLPAAEITGTDCLGQPAVNELPGGDFFHSAFKDVLDLASTMPNPLGFLSFFFELLTAFLTAAAEQLIDGLPLCQIYNIAQEASFDWTKRLAS
jgi:hypothetical protein